MNLELQTFTRDWMSDNRDMLRRNRTPEGYLPISLLVKRSGLTDLQIRRAMSEGIIEAKGRRADGEILVDYEMFWRYSADSGTTGMKKIIKLEGPGIDIESIPYVPSALCVNCQKPHSNKR